MSPNAARRRAWIVALPLLCGGLMMPPAWSANSVGEQIYRDGVLPSGAPLKADRQQGLRLTGATAACVRCHRRSGLGMSEGASSMPPIAGSYLFNPRAKNADELDLPFVEGMRPDRDPYTQTTLARAIREGVGADGRPFSVLMPRFELSDGEMAPLIDYLRSLSPGAVPGVEDGVLHFATIITPDADPRTRAGVLDVLNRFFDDKNHYTRSQGPRLRSERRMHFKVNRHWMLHVWELQGAPQSWEAQLREKLAQEPVFAVISGVGGRTWAPIHHFCEVQALPCLFPNVDLPVVAEHDFDDLYFNRGVLLEADLIAGAMSATQGTAESLGRVRRIVQVYRAGDVGEQAAEHLQRNLAHTGQSAGTAADKPIFIMRAVAARSGQAPLQAALRDVGAGDLLVLWLRSEDLAGLDSPPGAVSAIYMSGRMGGLEFSPLPAAWRGRVHMSYPYDLPDRSRVQMDYPLGWFRIRGIPVLDRQAQADTYLACQILSDTLNHMVDTFVRDYLVEKIEQMIEHRVVTGAYPRLALAPEQRFASRGGYLVHFDGTAGTKVIADTSWTVP